MARISTGVELDPPGALRGFCAVGLPLVVTALVLAGCQRETEASVPEIRPVRTVTVAKRDVGEIVSFTGRIEAELETRLSFRIGGRMIERSVRVGDRVEPGQVVAKLDSQNELNALRSAQAAVTAAQAQFTEAQNNYERQKFLLARDVASHVQYERAEQSRDTAGAQLDSAQAQLDVARDQVGDTELKADAGGIVIATAAEPGEVVQAGQLIIRVAPKGGRDAVFDVPGQMLRSAPREPLINVSLTDDPSVTTVGRVREVAPQADPVTRTFEVKVGLTDPPAAMRLGATVAGRMQINSSPTIEIPAAALTEFDRRAALWVVDPATKTVSLRNVEVQRHDPATVAIAKGLEVGEIVVTAGAQALHPGQKVRLLGPAPRRNSIFPNGRSSTARS
jgi:RND family efflux transporter MFP subunit